MNDASIWIGFDTREVDAYAVARASIRRHLRGRYVPICGLVLSELVGRGLYTRPTQHRDGRLWDCISDAPMSTEFACSRFLVPHLARAGWALFVDSDVLVRKSLDRLFAMRDPTKAVMVVKHDHRPENVTKKKDQLQQGYPRKNWSSVCLFNAGHPANRALTPALVNSIPGRDLHAFSWLDDDLIGELPAEWNWLAGHSNADVDPCLVHYTDGVPSSPGYEDSPFAEEWRTELECWAI